MSLTKIDLAVVKPNVRVKKLAADKMEQRPREFQRDRRNAGENPATPRGHRHDKSDELLHKFARLAIFLTVVEVAGRGEGDDAVAWPASDLVLEGHLDLVSVVEVGENLLSHLAAIVPHSLELVVREGQVRGVHEVLEQEVEGVRELPRGPQPTSLHLGHDLVGFVWEV